jgi:hypothetical protein
VDPGNSKRDSNAADDVRLTRTFVQVRKSGAFTEALVLPVSANDVFCEGEVTALKAATRL